MPSIVQVSVSQLIAPTPNLLQKRGAFISQGATNTTPGTMTLLTQFSSLTPFLSGIAALTSISYSGGTATATATLAHGITVGDTAWITVSGAAPVGYNGTYLATATTST